MNAATLIDAMAQYEVLLWLKRDGRWVRDADLMDAMDLDRAEITRIRQPLVQRGFVEICLGASRLTELGRDHAGDILDELCGPFSKGSTYSSAPGVHRTGSLV